MIPGSLLEWSIDLVHELARQSVFESDRFDLKEKLPDKRDDEGKGRLVKTCSSFANSDGGFLVFGVKDDRGLAPDQRVVGMDPTFDFPAAFGNYPARVQPSVVWTFRNPAIELPNGRLLHVVQIERRKGTPHAISEAERWVFCKRTSKGTEAMSYQEIRDGFVEARRIRREVTWLGSEIKRIREIAHTLNLESHHQRDREAFLFTRFRTGRLRDVVRVVFDIVGTDPQLVGNLEEIMDRSEKVDALLTPLATFAVLPKARSYSGAGPDPYLLVRVDAQQIVMNADWALEKLRTVVTRTLGA